MSDSPLQTIPYVDGTVLARVWPEALREGDRMHHLGKVRTVRHVQHASGPWSVVTFADGATAEMLATVWVLRDAEAQS